MFDQAWVDSLKGETIEGLSHRIGIWRRAQGFRTPNGIGTNTEAIEMIAKLMVVVTELAEAVEAVRNGDWVNFEEELADTIIRVLDICDACGIDAERIILEKMARNVLRPKLHGKKVDL